MKFDLRAAKSLSVSLTSLLDAALQLLKLAPYCFPLPYSSYKYSSGTVILLFHHLFSDCIIPSFHDYLS